MVESKFDRGLIVLNALILSFCSFGYQQTLALALSDATSDYVLSQTLTLGMFLIGLGLGGFLSDRWKASWRTLLSVEWCLAILGTASSAYIFTGEILLRFFGSGQPHWAMFAFAFPLVTGIGLLNGFELPLLMRLAAESRPGLVLCANYVGAFLAAAIVPLWIFPTFDVAGTGHMLGLVNFVAACLILPLCAPGWNRIAHLAIGLGLLWSMNAQTALTRFHLQSIYFAPHFTTLSSVFSPGALWSLLGSPVRIRSAYQWIDVVPPEFSDSIQGKQDFQIYLNRKIQVSSGSLLRYHESLAHGAVNLLKREPERVLILGGGDGVLAAELLKYTSLRHIDLVEIDPAMIQLGRRQKDLVRMNRNALNSQRVSVHIRDAFQFVKEHRKRPYDLILADLPFPSSYELSLLFTKEFYALVKRALGPNGVFALDFPSPGGPKDQLPVLVRTLEAAGFGRPFAFGSDDFFLAVSNAEEPLQFDLPSLSPRVANQTLINFVSRAREIELAEARPSRVNSVLFPVRFDREDAGGANPEIRGPLVPVFLSRFRDHWSRVAALGSHDLPFALKKYWDENFSGARDFVEEISPGLSWPRFQWGLEARNKTVVPIFQWFDVKDPARLRKEWSRATCMSDNSEWLGVNWAGDKSYAEFFVLREGKWVVRRYDHGSFTGEFPVSITATGMNSDLWRQNFSTTFNSPLKHPRAAAIQFVVQREFLINPRSLASGKDFERVYYP